jgi:MFS family permease
VLGASALAVFVSFASLLVFTFGIFLKPLTAAFGWSREEVSLAFGIAAISVALCSPLLGHLLDRFGPRRIIVPCVILFGSAFASLSLLTPHIWHLYAVFVALGMVGNGTAQMAYSRAISTWFNERRGFAFAVLMTGGAMGGVVWPPIAQALIANLGWRGAFAALGTLALAIALPMVLSSVRERAAAGESDARGAAGASVREGLQSRAFWIVVAMLFLVSLGQNGAIMHLSAMLTDHGVPAGGAALGVSALGAATLIGRLGTGWLLDRFFAPHVAMFLLGASALGIFLLGHAHSLAAGMTAAALIGAGMGGEADITPYLLSRYFGLKSFSTLYGFSWTAYAIAAAIGPVLMGKAFDASSSYESVLWKLGLLTAIAAWLMVFLPRYGQAVQVDLNGLKSTKVAVE